MGELDTDYALIGPNTHTCYLFRRLNAKLGFLYSF